MGNSPGLMDLMSSPKGFGFLCCCRVKAKQVEIIQISRNPPNPLLFKLATSKHLRIFYSLIFTVQVGTPGYSQAGRCPGDTALL